MSFYGGRTGQHFYIAATYSNEAEMNDNIDNILANQFVLVFNDTHNSTIWIKLNNEFKKVGEIGAFFPSINDAGEWQIGDGMPLGKATPDQLYLRVPYDRESDTYSSDILEYAYGIEGQNNNQTYLDSLNWLPLVNFEGLTNLAIHREKAEQALTEIQNLQSDIDEDNKEVVFLSQVVKSYLNGKGVFDENLTIPAGYEELSFERQENQLEDNAQYYADSAKASLDTLENSVAKVETAKELILQTIESGQKIEYLDLKTELDMAARRDNALGSAQEAYFLTDRLDNFLYQFDTYSEMRKCRQLRPGDTCTALGVSRLGDSNSILFRVYDPKTNQDTGETLDDRLKKDLYWDAESQKYFINLPGGSKIASEKQSLDNGYVAYSVAMFSGLGGGGSGGGGTGAGSLSVSFDKTSVELPDANSNGYEISYTWYGTVSGDGKLFVRDNIDGDVITNLTVPEGNQSFMWKPKNKGKHVLTIYVKDRMNQNTNVVILNIDVGSLELIAKTSSGGRFSAGQQILISYEAIALEKGPVTFVGGLYKNNTLIQTINYVSEKNTDKHTPQFEFANLYDIGQYEVRITAQSGVLTSAEVAINFLIVVAGELSIIEMYDETIEHPAGQFIKIDYQAYYKNATSSQEFDAAFYIRGGAILEKNCTHNVQGVMYQLLSENKIEPNKDLYYTLQGDFLIQSEIPYEFMIKVYDPSSKKVAYLSEPLLIKIIAAETEKYPEVEEWGHTALVHYFDSRLGQQNSDNDKMIWKNIASKYYDKKGQTGTTNIMMGENSFNWDTNGWNVTLNNTLYEGLRFDGNAYAYLLPGIDDIFKEGFFSDQNRGATVDIYFKPYYTGVDARLFEYSFNSNLLTGLIITETTASMSGSAASTANDISVEFTPNQPTHITFVYEPIGTTVTVDEEGNELPAGFMKIYLNGVCCAAKTLTADFKPDTSLGIYFNKSQNTTKTETKIGEQEIYTFRTFNRYLSGDEILALYIKDLPVSIRKTEYEKNFGVEDPVTKKKILPFDLPEVHFYLYAENMDGMDKDTAHRVRVELWKHGREQPESTEWDYCEVAWQGTSSIAYPVKNYKIKLRKKDGDGDKKIKYQLYHGLELDETTAKPLYPRGKKESTFTMKADYMDSSHCHNTGNANLVNDTGLLFNYSLTPAQVRDLDSHLKEDQSSLYQNQSYYKQLTDGSYRPYKMSDYTDKGGLSSDLEIRNSIYGFPCRLYMHKGTKNLDGTWSWGGENYLGIYNFNHDKGCTDTFGLYRTDDVEGVDGEERETAIFPHCTSFEIKANNDATAGAFKTRQFVKVHIYDDKGQEIETKYGVTSLNTIYTTEEQKDGSIKGKVIYNLEQTDIEKQTNHCAVYFCDADGSNMATNVTYVLQKNLEKIDAPNTEAYAKYLRSYYETSFELRFPDDKQYRWKKDPSNPDKWLFTEEYYSEYDAIKALIDWTDNATDEEFERDFSKHFDFDSALNYFLFVMATGLIDNFGKNLMLNTWGLNSEGKIPYVINNGVALLRYFDFDSNQYIYGYTPADNLTNSTINIYSDENCNNLYTSQYGIDESGNYDINKLNLRIYEDEDENLVRTWEQVVDIANIVWYPHPYDLDSCLGSDNSGYLRYGTDIEMLPINGNYGFNDFYTKTWNYLGTPFNTAASSLWYKFQKIYASQIMSRYADLRQQKILHTDTFEEYYYNQQISKMTKMDYNKDGAAKYLDDTAANVVVDGEKTQVYPSAYAVINRGDDWGRLKLWIEKRLNFLDSLYEYNLKTSVVEARANNSTNYQISITTHDPQYVLVSWTNEADVGDTSYQQEVPSYLNGDTTKYYLAQTYLNGFEEYGISDQKLYSKTSNGYVEDAENGTHHYFYKATYEAPYWIMNNGEPEGMGYYSPSDWYFDLKLAKNIQKLKISKQFKTDASGRIKLVDDIGSFSKKNAATNDQEVQIFGAYNLKTITGLTSLNPSKLIMKAASKLQSLECESESLAEVDISNAVMLRDINLHGCKKLTALLAPNARRLEKLNLGMSGVSILTLPPDGGNLKTLVLGPSMTEIELRKQRQLFNVTLQTDMRLQNNASDVGSFLSATKPIQSIILEDCPNLSFDFQVICEKWNGIDYEANEITIPQSSQSFQDFKNNYGIFSLFDQLNKLEIGNSYIYSENNTRGIDKEFRLSILATGEEDRPEGSNKGKINYGPLSSLSIDIPIEKIIFNNRDNSTGIVWPGYGISAVSSTGNPMEDRANTFKVSGSVKEIAVIGKGTIYMPCVNYWNYMPGLEKVTFEGSIKNKESRLDYQDSSDGVEQNALVIILPDKVDIGENKKAQVFKEFTLNTVNGETFYDVDITSIISASTLTDKTNPYTFPYASENYKVNDNYKIVDISKFTENNIKINFSQLKNIKTIKGFENINIGLEIDPEEPKLSTFKYLFSNCNNLTNIYDSNNDKYDIINAVHFDKNLFTYNTPSMDYMFYKCYNLLPEYITPLFNNRVANQNLTSAKYMVRECNQLEEIDLKWLNAENLTSLKGLAYDCQKLKKLTLDLTTQNKFEDLSYLAYFTHSSSIAAPKSKLETFELNIRGINDPSSNSMMAYVKDMSYMLHNASALQILDMSSWNLNSIETINNLCHYCSKLEKVIAPKGNKMLSNEENAYEFENLIDLTDAFADCTNLSTFLANEKDKTGYYIWKFKKPGVFLTKLLYNNQNLGDTGLWSILQWPMLNVTSLESMLSNSRGQINLDLKNWNLSTITNAANLFYGYNTSIATPGELIYSGDRENRLLGENFLYGSQMFANAGFSKIDTSIITPQAKLASISLMFKASPVSDLGEGYKSWNVSSITEFKEIFAGTAMSSLDLDNWNFNNGYNFTGMLSGMSNLTSLGSKQGISHLITTDNIHQNTEQEYSITNFFNGCGQLPEAYIKQFINWKVSRKVSSLEGLFAGCTLLSTTDNLFDTNIIYGSGMGAEPTISIKSLFNGCSGLIKVKLPVMHIINEGIASAFQDTFMDYNIAESSTQSTMLDLSQVNLKNVVGGSYDKTFDNCKALQFKFQKDSIRTSIDLSNLNNSTFVYDAQLNIDAVRILFAAPTADNTDPPTTSLLYGLADYPVTSVTNDIKINTTMETYLNTLPEDSGFLYYLNKNAPLGQKWKVSLA